MKSASSPGPGNENKQMPYKIHRLNSLLALTMPLIQDLRNRISDFGSVGNVGIEMKNKGTSYKSYTSDFRYLSFKGSSANITI